MPRRRLILCSCASALGLGVAGLAGADDGIVIGQTGADTVCMVGSDFVAVQLAVSGGTAYVVPKGGSKVLNWSAAGGFGGQEAFVLVRPTGAPLEYRVVASTAAQTLTDPMNRFKAGEFKVKRGDLVAFWVEDLTLCAHQTENPNDVVALFTTGPEPPAPGTVATVFPIQGFRLNMSATLTPSP